MNKSISSGGMNPSIVGVGMTAVPIYAETPIKSNAEADNVVSVIKYDSGQNKESEYIVTGEQLLANRIWEIPTLLDPIFPKVGLVALAGASDTGKSSLLRQMACAIVTGEKEFLGFKLNAEHKSAIYLSTEDDELALSYLLGKQNNGKYPNEKFKNLRFIFESERILEKLDHALSQKPADCVIFDAFADGFDGDMNQSNKVRSFLNKYSDLAKKHKCLVIFLHHVGKRREEYEPSKSNLLGSQGFEAKMRLVIELRQDFTNPSIRHFCIVKGNYLKSEFKEQSYVLHFDNDMLFHNANERVPFAKLAKPVNPDSEKALITEKVMKLHEQGLSTREISESLKAEGVKVSKSTVAKRVKSCPPIPQPLEIIENGQEINQIDK